MCRHLPHKREIHGSQRGHSTVSQEAISILSNGDKHRHTAYAEEDQSTADDYKRSHQWVNGRILVFLRQGLCDHW
jgi:hypothetical protein